ncbi:hypothetical protein MKW98_008064 [Papaver atlanticum]|uniref:Amine oxidase domain-containing protein n=1 Tax=Papaver atlanticum TaxID=357466 RepID=A0AAD4S7K5_9MAGN|nr:hypothetical protein MKW98_008064 [Papaver atlanticum]
MGMERVPMVSVLFTVLVTFLGVYDLPQTMAAAREPPPAVIVVGAGMSGISAAKTLSDAGIKNILILEATNRIGGRIKKTNFAGLSVELGANWVEGVKGDQVNPIWTMVNKIGLKTYYSDFDHLANHTYKQMYGYLEFGEPPRVTSLQNTEPLQTFTDFGEDYYFVADSRGYESVVHYVAKQFLTTDKDGDITDPRLVLNKAVTKIQYSKSGVMVKTEDGSVYKAEYVMVSASIGVLQTNLIDFVPDLPAWKLLAIYQFDMSIYTKIFLKFPYKFWPTGNGTEFFIHAHEKRGYYTIWQQLENEYPGANCLLVTVTDDESRRVEQQPDSETLAEIMDVLRNMFGKNIPDATDILVPKWWSDRFYKGTFSNWPIGVDQHEFDQIRAPVGRVYFTGEHTSEHYNGYVHGAYLAGIDSANILIKCAKKKMCNYNIKPKST